MKVFIAGMDGFLGWTLTVHLLSRGHEVGGCDCFLRRKWVKELGSRSVIPIPTMSERIQACIDVFKRRPIFYEGDLRDTEFVYRVIRDFSPDVIVHLGEMPSAPYSMIDAKHAIYSQVNNISGTLNLLFAMRDLCPQTPMVKLGCYDDRTEVLTENGWKLFKDLTYQDKVCCLNGKTEKIQYYHPERIVEYPYSGLILKIIPLDLVITPNHRVVFRREAGGPIEIKRATDLLNQKIYIPGETDVEITPEAYEWVPYRGKVFCCTVPTGIMYVRRNGKAVWSGNTLGEYGTPNIDIPEGPFEVEFNGRRDILPFPKQPYSFYHASKVHDTTNIQLACKLWNLRVTDIMQGVVYGVQIPEMAGHEELFTRLDVDECFPPGTKILCMGGEKPIEEVQVGDRVLTHKGRFRRVLKKFEREYAGDIIEIKLEFSLGRIICTPNHPILVTSYSFLHDSEVTRWMTAHELHKYSGNSTINRCHWSAEAREFDLVKIESTSSKFYKGKVYNLHVEEDHSYVANNIAVHNCFGTYVNRLCSQAVIEHPLTVYGTGRQRRGFLPLQDSMQCLQIAIENPPKEGEYRVFNQFEGVFPLIGLAEIILQESKRLGFRTQIHFLDNPRAEVEDHYYNPIRKNLPRLGYKPTGDPQKVIRNILVTISKFKDRIVKEKIMPTIRWITS